MVGFSEDIREIRENVKAIQRMMIFVDAEFLLDVKTWNAERGRVERHYYTANTSSSLSPRKLCTVPQHFANYGISAVVGSFIYHMGGSYSAEDLTSEVYRLNIRYPHEGWQSVRSMNTERREFYAASLAGRIYVFGGNNSEGAPMGEVYNPSTDTWTIFPDPPPGCSPAGIRIYPSSPDSHFIMVETAIGLVAFHAESLSWSLPPVPIEGHHVDVGFSAMFMGDSIYSFHYRGSCVSDLVAVQLELWGSYRVLNRFQVTTGTMVSQSSIYFLVPLINRKICLVRKADFRGTCWDACDTYTLQLFQVVAPERSGKLEFSATFTIEECNALVNVLPLYEV